MDKYKLIPALALVALAGGTYASEPVEPEQKLVEEGEEYEEVVMEPEAKMVEYPDSLVKELTTIQIIENEEYPEQYIGNVNMEGVADIEAVESATKVIVVMPEPSGANQSASSSREKVYDAVEVLAQFPGGPGRLNQWLKNNMRYPEDAYNNGVEGRVIVQFVIEKDGSITNPVIVRGIDKELDREAIRLVKAMPKWIPGRNNDMPVRSRYTMPVTFKLQH